jgi:putative transposase
MKRYLSAAELAELVRLPDWPTTKRGVQDRLTVLSVPSRKRAGRGGGREYAVSALPEAVQIALGVQQLPAVPKPARMVKPIVALKTWQKRVLDHRAVVLDAIEGLRLQALAGGAVMSVAGSIDAFLDLLERGEVSDDLAFHVKKANARNRAGKRKLSRSTIYNWLKDREAAGDVAGLAPQAAREEAPPAWLADFLPHFAKPQKPSIRTALANYEKVLPAGATAPSYAQVRYAIGQMDNRLRIMGRMGPRERKRMLSYVARSTEDLWSTALYTADGHTFKAHCAHPRSGRPFRVEVTAVLDAYSRRIVSHVVGQTENSLDVAAALSQAFMTGGVPAFFYTDNGSGFNNQVIDAETTGLLSRFEVGHPTAIAYNAQARGLIERPNSSILVKVAKAFVTYCGDDMDEEARQRIYKRIKAELRETGASKTLPGFDAVVTAIGAEIDAYNGRPHSSLPVIEDPETGRRRHMTPNERWEQGLQKARDLGLPLEVVEPHEVFELWPSEIRTCRRGLVAINNGEYFAKPLEAFQGEDVEVRFHPHDPSFVMVVPPRGAPIRAELDGHKQPYLPKSVVEQQAERRGLNALKRIEQKAERVRELHFGTMLQAEPMRPLVTISNEERERHEAWVAEQEREAELIPARRDPEAERRADIRRWASIDRAIAGGIGIDPDDARFHQVFQRQPEFRGLKEAIDELPDIFGEIPAYRRKSEAAPQPEAKADLRRRDADAA